MRLGIRFLEDLEDLKDVFFLSYWYRERSGRRPISSWEKNERGMPMRGSFDHGVITRNPGVEFGEMICMIRGRYEISMKIVLPSYILPIFLSGFELWTWSRRLRHDEGCLFIPSRSATRRTPCQITTIFRRYRYETQTEDARRVGKTRKVWFPPVPNTPKEKGRKKNMHTCPCLSHIFVHTYDHRMMFANTDYLQQPGFAIANPPPPSLISR